MSEVKAPDLREAARDALLACEETASWARLRNEAVSKRLWRVVTALRAALEAEYVPAIDSPDREPDAWLRNLAIALDGALRELLHASFQAEAPEWQWLLAKAWNRASELVDLSEPSLATTLKATSADRSVGLREALEDFTVTVGAVCSEIPRLRGKMPGGPGTQEMALVNAMNKELDDALAAARLALKAEEANE